MASGQVICRLAQVQGVHLRIESLFTKTTCLMDWPPPWASPPPLAPSPFRSPPAATSPFQAPDVSFAGVSMGKVDMTAHHQPRHQHPRTTTSSPSRWRPRLQRLVAAAPSSPASRRRRTWPAATSPSHRRAHRLLKTEWACSAPSNSGTPRSPSTAPSTSASTRSRCTWSRSCRDSRAAATPGMADWRMTDSRKSSAPFSGAGRAGPGGPDQCTCRSCVVFSHWTGLLDSAPVE